MKQEKPRAFSTSALVHEVRNPLTSIDLAVDMLLSTFLDSDQKIYVDIIKRASFRVNGLVTEIHKANEYVQNITVRHGPFVRSSRN
jgi:signal transduction histidine kinase